MIFGLTRSLARMLRVSVIDFGNSNSTRNVDGVPIILLRARLRIPNSRGLIPYNWNAFTSAFKLFLGLLARSDFSRSTLLHFHSGTQFVVFRALLLIFRPNSDIHLIYSHHSPRWMDLGSVSLLTRLAAVVTEFSAIEHAEFVTFESEAVAENIAKLSRMPAHFMVLPNGVDTEYFSNKRFESAEIANGIFYGARIKRQKDQLSVVRAMSRVTQSGFDAHLLLLGDPEDLDYAEEVYAEVKRLGLDRQIEFMPSVDIDELNFLRMQYPVHVIYSSYTGFDVAVGETLSLARACVFSDIPPLKGIAVSGENCLLVPARNPVELALAIQALFSNDNLRKSVSMRARETAVAKLSWETLATSFLARVAESLA